MIYVHPSDRLSTKVLRLLDRTAQPMTLAAIAEALRLGEADARRLSPMLRNFHNRGRVVVAARLTTGTGRPALWAITDAARDALATGRGRPKPAGGWRFPKSPNPKRRRAGGRDAGPVVGIRPVGEPLWDRASAVVPRTIPRALREDLISELIVAQLEGEQDLMAAFRRKRAELCRPAHHERALVSRDGGFLIDVMPWGAAA